MGRTLLCDELGVAGNELDDSVGDGGALLERKNTGNHVEKEILKDAFAGELEALSVLDGLCDGGGIGV